MTLQWYRYKEHFFKPDMRSYLGVQRAKPFAGSARVYLASFSSYGPQARKEMYEWMSALNP
jgi:hypothetical protein